MRKICVVTGTRAEYGLLQLLMKEIAEDPGLELQVVATGMHLAPEFGSTYRAIEADGFRIDAKVEMLLASDTPVGVTKSLGLGVIGFADALDRLAPDLLVVLGDRYEILAAVQAALVARVPVAHIHGGETTEGAIDEAIRHSITKMAHLHFVAAEPYRQRVIQLGESPERVFNFGAPGLEQIARLQPLERDALQASLGFQLGALNFLVTYHPVTLDAAGPAAAMQELLSALDLFPDAKLIFTKPNSDAGGKEIARLIDDYVAARPGRAAAFASLGQLRYLSALAQVDLVVGNSSSGLIEVPMFGKPTVNVGERQAGRRRASSVIDCRETAADIGAAIRKALSPAFQQTLERISTVYDADATAFKIKEELKQVKLDEILIKRFHDLKPAP